MKCLSAIVALSLIFPGPAAAAEAPAPQVEAEPTPYFMDLNLTRLITCVEGDGAYLGTGTSISATDIVTAAHVIAAGKCSVGGVPVTVVYQDPNRDFAVVRTALPSPRRVVVSCAGFREGEDYFGLGYAHGTDFAIQRFTGTGNWSTAFKGRLSVLRGKGFHGQSGGPIYDGSGRLVGIVNAGPEDGTPLLLSLPMSETYLCKRSVASVDRGATLR